MKKWRMYGADRGTGKTDQRTFAPMHTIDFCLALIAGFVSITWFEIMKIFMHREHINLLEDKT